MTTEKQQYRDLDLDFFANPSTGDVAIKTGPQAVIRSIRNLVKTNFYDRPFRSAIGSNVINLLFEPISPFTQNLIEQFVTEVINNFEPRAALVSVNAKVRPDENGYECTIVFYVVNIADPIVTSIFLQRVR